MTTANAARQQANIDEAVLLRSFDQLERALSEKGNENSAEWAEVLRTRLSDVESALARHQNSAVASENPAEEQRSRSNIPATIERRWDKLRQATQNLLRRVQDLRQRAECAAQGRAARNQGCEVVELEQAIAELIPALRDLKAREQALLADNVTLEVGVGD